MVQPILNLKKTTRNVAELYWIQAIRLRANKTQGNGSTTTNIFAGVRLKFSNIHKLSVLDKQNLRVNITWIFNLIKYTFIYLLWYVFIESQNYNVACQMDKV